MLARREFLRRAAAVVVMATGLTERESQRRLMSRKRAAARDIEIPPCADMKRRSRLEADTPAWLGYYFGDRLRNPFTEDQLEWIRDIEHGMRFGGDHSIGAPRGEGKTTIAEGVILKAILTGTIRYAVLVAATGPHAKRSLKNIRRAIEKNELLSADYPEVCVPVKEMDRAPQRAKKQTYNGAYTDMRWETDAIALPTIPGSRCSGSMISCHGLDSAVRGINEEGLRPDFVLIDDPETRESAVSEIQIATREEIIEKDLAGLAGPGVICGRLMLCTLQNKTCLAAKYTDPTQKPSWGGKRYRLLPKLPDRTDLWDEYLEFRRQDVEKANQFYAANRASMDAGAVVSNPSRYIPGQELSALQHCYNWVSRIGWDNFRTEFQNDPPAELGPEESGISALLVASRLHNYPHRTLPDGCGTLTIGVDVGIHRLHWVAIAWQPGAIGFIVDYDELRVLGTSPEDSEQLTAEKAILRALVDLRQQWIEEPFATETGEILEPKFVMIDSGSGLHQEAVYQFVRTVGHRPFVAAKGFARGHGMTPFYAGKATPTRRIGDHWFQTRQDNAPDIWLHGFDADYWKRFVHQRFLTPTEESPGVYRNGTLSLWKSEMSNRHTKFAKQIEAEVWVTDFKEGKTGEKEYWERRRRDNHYLDACAMACAGASMANIRLIGEPRAQRRYIPLGQMGKKAS